VKPLDGIVVLDLTRLLPGAAATQLLAQFGAEVIKVEEPGRGDYARSMPPLVDGEGAVFRMVNRGKKSVAIDLKDPPGKAAFLRLLERADVLVEGFRPGVMKRLGLDYQALRERYPRLIYVALTGYGQSGPYASLAGHDINYLSLAGVLDITGTQDGPPAIPGVQIADLAGGAMQAVIGVLLALAARHNTGRGQLVDVSMLDGSVWLLPVPMALYAATGWAPRRGDTRLSGRYACYNVYQARDGRWLAVGALEPKFWAALCHGLGREDLTPDQYAEGPRQAEIIETLRAIFRTRDAGEWFERFRSTDACVTPLQDMAEVARDAHLRHREMIVDGAIGVMPKLSETPGSPGGPPPRLGEHNDEVLR
jgi:crotonobetainyl-CoA:carnitine CoA-transferase CaiB-like acyl-CoA transferase